MRLVKPMVIVEDDLSMLLPNGLTLAQHMMKKTELFTRTCYKSEGKMTEDSYKTFIRDKFQKVKHQGIAEHRMISVRFITDRGISHEGVRTRVGAAFLQESTRYCDYTEGDVKSKGMTFILPPWIKPHALDPDWTKNRDSEFAEFVDGLRYDEARYNSWRKNRNWTPQQARGWLPHFIKTEYVGSKTLMAWWLWCTKRACDMSGKAHPQMRQLAITLLLYLQEHLDPIFGGLVTPYYEYEDQLAALIVNPYYDTVPLVEVPI